MQMCGSKQSSSSSQSSATTQRDERIAASDQAIVIKDVSFAGGGGGRQLNPYPERGGGQYINGGGASGGGSIYIRQESPEALRLAAGVTAGAKETVEFIARDAALFVADANQRAIASADRSAELVAIASQAAQDISLESTKNALDFGTVSLEFANETREDAFSFGGDTLGTAFDFTNDVWQQLLTNQDEERAAVFGFAGEAIAEIAESSKDETERLQQQIVILAGVAVVMVGVTQIFRKR
jgi:hypothetical protein